MVANHHYWLHVNTYIHFSHQHVIYVAGSGSNWFWTRTEPSRTGSGRFSSGSGSVHPWGSWFWFWFSKNGLRTELNWTLATLSWPWQLADLCHPICTQSQDKYMWMDVSKHNLLNRAPVHEWAMWAHLLLLFFSFVNAFFPLYLLYLDTPLSLCLFGIHMYPSALQPLHLTIYV